MAGILFPNVNMLWKRFFPPPHHPNSSLMMLGFVFTNTLDKTPSELLLLFHLPGKLWNIWTTTCKSYWNFLEWDLSFTFVSHGRLAPGIRDLLGSTCLSPEPKLPSELQIFLFFWQLCPCPIWSCTPEMSFLFRRDKISFCNTWYWCQCFKPMKIQVFHTSFALQCRIPESLRLEKPSKIESNP